MRGVRVCVCVGGGRMDGLKACWGFRVGVRGQRESEMDPKRRQEDANIRPGTVPERRRAGNGRAGREGLGGLDHS